MSAGRSWPVHFQKDPAKLELLRVPLHTDATRSHALPRANRARTRDVIHMRQLFTAWGYFLFFYFFAEVAKHPVSLGVIIQLLRSSVHQRGEAQNVGHFILFLLPQPLFPEHAPRPRPSSG